MIILMDIALMTKATLGEKSMTSAGNMIKHHWIDFKVKLETLLENVTKQALIQYEIDNLPECTLTDYEYDDLRALGKLWYGLEDTPSKAGLEDIKRWEPKYIRQAFEYIKELSKLLVKFYPMDFDDGYNPCKTLPWR